MKTKMIVGFVVVFVCAAALLYAHQRGGSAIPSVEVNARFADADTNGDGALSKEEFAKYLATQTPKKSATQSDVRICPNTGAPCTGDGSGMCSSGNGEACGGGGCGSGSGGCCDDKSAGVKTVPVKSTTVTKNAGKKEGGCCGSKDKADKKEGGCCGGKDKADKKEGGCCSGKDKADRKEGGCCGGKDKAESEQKEDVSAETTTPENKE